MTTRSAKHDAALAIRPPTKPPILQRSRRSNLSATGGELRLKILAGPATCPFAQTKTTPTRSQILERERSSIGKTTNRSISLFLSLLLLRFSRSLPQESYRCSSGRDLVIANLDSGRQSNNIEQLYRRTMRAIGRPIVPRSIGQGFYCLDICLDTCLDI